MEYTKTNKTGETNNASLNSARVFQQKSLIRGMDRLDIIMVNDLLRIVAVRDMVSAMVFSVPVPNDTRLRAAIGRLLVATTTTPRLDRAELLKEALRFLARRRPMWDR